MARLSADRRITEKAARAIFMRSFITTRRELFYPMLVEVHDSHVKTDFAAMIGTVPQVEEVIGQTSDPMTSDFVDYRVQWDNKLYKSKITISRDLLDFDQTGQARTLIHSMGARLANWPEKLMVNRILNATSTAVPAFESSATPYFDTNHQIGGIAAAMNNIVTGSTSLPFIRATAPQTVAQQLQSDLREAIARMSSFTDDRGEPFHFDNVAPENLVILCSPELTEPFNIAIGSETINATTNMFANRVRKVITTNYIGTAFTNAADLPSWYLFHVGERVRPFKYSRFRRIRDEELEDFGIDEELSRASGFENISMDIVKDFSTVELQTNLGHYGANAEYDVIQNDRFFIGARWRGEIFGGEWRNAVKVSNSGT